MQKNVQFELIQIYKFKTSKFAQIKKNIIIRSKELVIRNIQLNFIKL